MTERDIKYNAFVVSDTQNNLGRLVNGCAELKYLLDHPEANKVFAKHYENEILTYATKFSPFYAKYANFKSLQDFPILTKADLKKHWNEITPPNSLIVRLFAQNSPAAPQVLLSR